MPLLGDSQYEAAISRMQEAEHQKTCRRRDEDAAEVADPELEELFAFFDQPEPRLPSPPEEDDMALWVLDRLVAVEIDRRPCMSAGGWDAETGEEEWA